LGDHVSPEQAEEKGHTHIAQLAEPRRVHALRGVGRLVLTHFSTRHTRQQIDEAIAALPDELRAKTSALVLDGYHRPGCATAATAPSPAAALAEGALCSCCAAPVSATASAPALNSGNLQ